MRLALAFLSVFATGCTTSTLYTTADVVKDGGQWILAPEAWTIAKTSNDPPSGSVPVSDPYPWRTVHESFASVFPTTIIRTAVADDVELGVGTVRTDLKARLVRTTHWSFAIDPTSRVLATMTGGGLAFDAPLLATLRASDTHRITGNAGYTLVRMLLRQGPAYGN